MLTYVIDYYTGSDNRNGCVDTEGLSPYRLLALVIGGGPGAEAAATASNTKGDHPPQHQPERGSRLTV